MSLIWNKLIECQDEIIKIFNERATEYDEPGLAHFNSDTWVNRVWRNDHVRRAHIDVVDARESKGLWMMHVCIFPVIQNDGAEDEERWVLTKLIYRAFLRSVSSP